MPHHSDDTSPAPDDPSITLEHARTAILRFLARYDGTVETLELVTVAVRETECDRRSLSVADLPFVDVHDRVTATHLPALDREGLVDYDPAAETVELAVSTDELSDAIEGDEVEC